MTGKRTALPLPAPAIRPVADEWEWQESARCRSMDSSVFFHPDNERAGHADNANNVPKRFVSSAR